MKKLFLLFLGVLAFSLEINFANGVLMKSDLKERFVNYWNYRAHKEFSKAYNFEMPYLRYIHSKEEYEDFFANAPRIKKISVKRIDCKDNFCIIGMDISIYKKTFYKIDKWIKVDNTWYHRYDDRVLPF